MKKYVLWAALTLASLHPASAKDAAADEQVEINGKKPFVMQAGKSYILFRTNAAGYGPSFMRIPSDAEIAAFQKAKADAFERDKTKLAAEREKRLAQKAEAEKTGKVFKQDIPPVPTLENYAFVYDKVVNLQTLNVGKAIEKGKDERVMLVEVVPGDYVLYGIGYANVLATCFCLGTVGFSAPPGAIVDLGTILIGSASEKSDIPELASETGFGPSMNGHLVAFTAAIRPSKADATQPALLNGNAAGPARYRAVGTFVAPGVFNINRLAPIEGILGYDGGAVIDVARGERVPDNF